MRGRPKKFLVARLREPNLEGVEIPVYRGSKCNFIATTLLLNHLTVANHCN
jgi:hypothetical protein